MTAPAIKRLAPKLACSPPEPRLLSLLLVVGYVVQLALRVAISVGRDGPTNLADETGYLANARVMSGGVAGELSMAAFTAVAIRCCSCRRTSWETGRRPTTSTRLPSTRCCPAWSSRLSMCC